MPRFNPTTPNPGRAVQAWQILTGAAHNRQTLTYERLSEIMYQKEAAGVLSRILGHIAYYCIDNNLPPLTVIVVEKYSGIPGAEIPINEDINAARERVYQEDWYDIYPPNEAELRAAYDNHT